MAAFGGRAEVVKLLLDAGANVNLASKGGWVPLHWAALRGNYLAVQELIKHPELNVERKVCGYDAAALWRACAST